MGKKNKKKGRSGYDDEEFGGYEYDNSRKNKKSKSRNSYGGSAYEEDYDYSSGGEDDFGEEVDYSSGGEDDWGEEENLEEDDFEEDDESLEEEEEDEDDEDEEEEEEEEEEAPVRSSSASVFSVSTKPAGQSAGYGGGSSSGLTPRQATPQPSSSYAGSQGQKQSSLASLRPTATSFPSGKADAVSANEFKPVRATASPTSNLGNVPKSGGIASSPHAPKKEDLKMQDSPDDEVVDWSRAKQKGALAQSTEDDVDEEEVLRRERISELEKEISEVRQKIEELDELCQTPDISQDDLDKFSQERDEQQEKLERLEEELSGLTSNVFQKIMAPLVSLGRLPSALKARAVSFWESRRSAKNDEELDDSDSKKRSELSSEKNNSSSNHTRRLHGDEDDEDNPQDDDRYATPARNWQRIIKRTGIVASVTTLGLVVATIGIRFFSGKSNVADDGKKVASAKSDVDSEKSEKSLLEKLSSKTEGATRAITKTKDEALKKVSDATDSIVDAFSNTRDDSTEDSKSPFDALSEDFLKEDVDDLNNKAVGSASNFVDSAVDAVDGLASEIPEFSKNVQDTANDLYDKTSQTADDMIDSMVDASDSILDSVSSAAEKVVDSVKNGSDEISAPNSVNISDDDLTVAQSDDMIDSQEGSFEFGSTPARNAPARTGSSSVNDDELLPIDEEVGISNVNSNIADWEDSESAASDPASSPADAPSVDLFDVSNATPDPTEDGLASNSGDSNWTNAAGEEGNSPTSGAYATPIEPLESGAYAAQVETPGESAELPNLGSELSNSGASSLGMSNESQLADPAGLAASPDVPSLDSSELLRDSSSLGNSLTTANDSAAVPESSSLGSPTLSSLAPDTSLSNVSLSETDQNYNLTLGDASNAVLDVDDSADLNALSGANSNNWSNNGALDQLNAQSNNVESLGSQLSNGLNKLNDQASSALDSFNEQINGLGERIAETTNSWQNNAQQGLDSLNQSLNEGAAGLQGLADNLNTGINDLGSGLSNTLDQGVASVQQGYDNLTNSLSNAYDSTVGSLQQAGDNIRSNLQNLQNSLSDVNPLNSQNASNGALPLDSSLNPSSTLANDVGASQSAPLTTLGSESNVPTTTSLPTQLNQYAGTASDSPQIGTNALTTPSANTGSALPQSAPDLTAVSTPSTSIAPAPTTMQTSVTNVAPNVATNSVNSNSLNPTVLPLAGTTPNALNSAVAGAPASPTVNSTIPSTLATPPNYSMSPLAQYSNASVSSSQLSTPVASSTNPVASMPPVATSTSPVSQFPTAGVGQVAVAAPSYAAQAQTGYREYITKEGDNLLTIAENELGSSSRWGEIKRLNNLPYGSTYFDVGTRLKIPVQPSSR